MIQAELDPGAKVLDSSEDDNATYLREFYEFRGKTDLETGTLEFQRAFTEYLRGKGYDVVKIRASLLGNQLGNHTEVIVINEDKLKYVGKL